MLCYFIFVMYDVMLVIWFVCKVLFFVLDEVVCVLKFLLVILNFYCGFIVCSSECFCCVMSECLVEGDEFVLYGYVYLDD